MSLANDATMDSFLNQFFHDKKVITISFSENDYQKGVIIGFNDTLIVLKVSDNQTAIITRSKITYVFFNKK